ncbi:unnamed protein product [Meganyctiphanes norvegica]|uniref:Protein quiver n=1 Tax=Meganyctiphanes norvegica TaxID=48144 RepID=A0AAV2SAD6_MEGNR
MKFLLATVALVALIHQGTSISCYECDNTPGTPDQYDDNCGNPDYANPDFIIEFGDAKCCTLIVWGNGDVVRSATNDCEGDGQCNIYGTMTVCNCTGDLCNNDLCETYDCIES